MYNSKRKLCFTILPHKTTKKRRRHESVSGQSCGSVVGISEDSVAEILDVSVGGISEDSVSGISDHSVSLSRISDSSTSWISRTSDISTDCLGGPSISRSDHDCNMPLYSEELSRDVSQSDSDSLSTSEGILVSENCPDSPYKLLIVERDIQVVTEDNGAPNTKPTLDLSQPQNPTNIENECVFETQDDLNNKVRETEDICIENNWRNGGFRKITDIDGSSGSDVFIFPKKVISSQDREIILKTFVAKLYNLDGPARDSDVDILLTKMSGQAPSNLPTPALAKSTPGPRVPELPSIYAHHSADDSLRVINQLQLSEDDARYVRGIALVPLDTEYAVKKRKLELMGGQSGKKWVEVKKYSLRRWFRKEKEENKHLNKGGAARRDWVVGSIKQDNMAEAVQHWAKELTDRGQFVSLGDLSDCPEFLRDAVVAVIGNDSGQGRTREGLRFVNRPQANSGAKVFVTGMINRSDKGLSLGQKQHIFSQMLSLKNLTTINMGHRERKLILISCMDYEGL